MTFAEFEVRLDALVRLYNRIGALYTKVDILVEIAQLAREYVRGH